MLSEETPDGIHFISKNTTYKPTSLLKIDNFTDI